MKKFRYKLLVRFLAFSFIIIIIIIPVSLFYFKKKEAYSKISREIDKTYILLLQSINNQSYFFNYEKTNPVFFITANSQYLKHNTLLKHDIKNRLGAISTSFNDERINNLINRIDLELEQYDSLFSYISQLFYKRGFKDWGIEGEMRDYVHQLENFKEIDQKKVLTLRRHEKDYIIRNDANYIKKLKKVSSEFKNEIHNDKTILNDLKDSIINILDNYILHFGELVILERKTGLKDQSGLKKKLNEKTEKLELLFQQLMAEVNDYTQKAYRELKIYYLIGSILIFIISTMLSFMISDHITKPISSLSQGIKKFIDSGFKVAQNFDDRKKTNDEINLLTENFIILQNQIQSHIEDLNDKVRLRTLEITKQKNKIELQKKKIELQAKEVSKKNSLIEKQKQKLEVQNKNMMSSIVYAKNIQNAILPDPISSRKILPEHFIIYQPRDIVSGDFYWLDKIETKNRELVMFAIADCTGHGVPGALMSIIGYNAINQAVKEEQKINPAHILSSVNKYVYHSLHKNGSNQIISDGLDIAFCILDKKCMSLEFAGTNRPMIIIRDEEIIEVKGEKISLGTELTVSRKIKRHKVKLKEGDTIYLFTDGYSDQFGGPKGKKMKHKNLKEKLLNIRNYSMKEQLKILEDHIREWMEYQGNNRQIQEQVDDILLIGIRI